MPMANSEVESTQNHIVTRLGSSWKNKTSRLHKEGLMVPGTNQWCTTRRQQIPDKARCGKSEKLSDGKKVGSVFVIKLT